MPLEKLLQSNTELWLPAPEIKELIPNAQLEPQTWSYTTEDAQAGQNWFTADYDDSSWKKGPGGFGKEGTLGAVVKTVWDTKDIWLRKSVELSANDISNPEKLFFEVYYFDEEVEIYINGVIAFKLSKGPTNYVVNTISAEAARALMAGRNLISVHCATNQANPNWQNIDIGFSKYLP
jgi:hypothetical protein